MLVTWVLIIVLSFVQNVSFSLVSRARNRDHTGYLVVTSLASNGVWFATMGVLVATELSVWLLPPYLVGTTLGSVFGARASMRIEKLLGAKT